ncbi:uncharacterized protein LOC126821518 isoform X2 [Patella vulgata]|uniref:uncharacterized protein LOC126821518 isoform X2 n=1 Tax=Patella vulgata TaxID=6465 RepID=UPI00217FA5CF|nr:uncharacterized protein LOC126821518 isoform X2 [Patella vulgata]
MTYLLLETKMELLLFALLQLSILRISYGCECESHILEAGRVQLNITPPNVVVGGETCLCCDHGDADGTVKFFLGDTQICKIVNDTTVPASTNATKRFITPNTTTVPLTTLSKTTTKQTTTTTERTTTIQRTIKSSPKPVTSKSTHNDELYKTTMAVPDSSTTEANNNHWLQQPLKELIPYIMAVIVILLVTLIIIKLVSMSNKRKFDKYGNKKSLNARHHIYDNIDDRNIPPILPPPRNDLQGAIDDISATEKTYYLTPVRPVNLEHKNVTPETTEMGEVPLVETSYTKPIPLENNTSYLTLSTIVNKPTMLSDGENKQSEICRKENVSGNTTSMKLDETDFKPSVYTNMNAVDIKNGIRLNDIAKTETPPTTENKYTLFPEETSTYLTPVHASSGITAGENIKTENTLVTENEYATTENPDEKSTKRTPIIYTKNKFSIPVVAKIQDEIPKGNVYTVNRDTRMSAVF